jgi:LysR family transcriptional regulator, malonate utilization transcriptional regulator
MSASLDEEVTFRRLEILLAFLEAGNLARAAERLGVSTVTVHRALHSLEAGVRCSLFRHEGRNLLPTDAAHALADVAQEVLRKMHEGVRLTREIAGYAADRIRIGSLYSLTSGTVPALIMGLRLRKPDLQTELVLGSNADLLLKLRDGSIDAAVMGAPEGQADIESQSLFVDDIHFAAPRGSTYEAMASVDLAACINERFVSLTEGFMTYTRFVEAFRVAGFMPDVVMKTGDIYTLMNLVGGGIGCTLLPGRVRSVMPREVRLIPLQPRYRMQQQISLCFLRTRERDPNLLSLLAACRQFAAEVGRGDEGIDAG